MQRQKEAVALATAQNRILQQQCKFSILGTQKHNLETQLLSRKQKLTWKLHYQ